MTKHTEWCRNHFDRMKPGAIWIIPRTGLVMRKTANALLWVATVPADLIYRKVPQELVDQMRDIEFTDNEEEFAQAGVPLLKASVIKSFNSGDEALAFYGKDNTDGILDLRVKP